MKIKTSLFTLFAIAFLSVSSAWAAAPKTPTEHEMKTAQDASKRLCEETAPNVGKAIAMILDGKTEAQARKFFHEKWKTDERLEKFYAISLDENGWINRIMPQIMSAAKGWTDKIDRSSYVEGMKIQYTASCRDDFKAMFLKEFAKSR